MTEVRASRRTVLAGVASLAVAGTGVAVVARQSAAASISAFSKSS